VEAAAAPGAGGKEESVGKLTGSKINLIIQHKTKNLDLLVYSIHNIRTEQI
jgi:hypothetical protein